MISLKTFRIVKEINPGGVPGLSYEFSQGDIVWFSFPNDPNKPQYTIKGKHPALILHDDTQPNQTIVLSPLSSLNDRTGERKEVKSYHLILYKEDYPSLTNDSYVKLDQIMTFSRHRAAGSSLICTLSDKDKAASHLKLMESLQMQETVKEITQKQLDAAVEKVLEEYIRDLINGTN
jgi:galactose-1-phosphate uridylyltransferase